MTFVFIRKLEDFEKKCQRFEANRRNILTLPHFVSRCVSSLETKERKCFISEIASVSLSNIRIANCLSSLCYGNSNINEPEAK